MPFVEADLLSAVSSAVDGETIPPLQAEADGADSVQETQTGDESADAVDETQTAEQSTEAGAPAPDADEPEAEAEGEQPVAGARERGPDGKFVKKEAAKEPATDPNAAKEAKAPKGKDIVNDPIPQGLKKETTERIQGLIQAVKTKDQERTAAIQDRDMLVKMVEDTGSSPEQYGAALNYLKMVNAKDAANAPAAIKFLQEELSYWSKLSGTPVPGVDLLAGHADLQQHVANGTMTEETATELAAARARTATQTQIQNTQRQQQQQETARAQAVEQGRVALNAIGAQLQKSDPQFAAKYAILKVALKPAMNQLDPSKWAETFQSAYDALVLPKAPAPSQTKVPGVPSNQPMRPRTPSGGAAKAPGSLLEAINMGLENVGG